MLKHPFRIPLIASQKSHCKEQLGPISSLLWVYGGWCSPTVPKSANTYAGGLVRLTVAIIALLNRSNMLAPYKVESFVVNKLPIELIINKTYEFSRDGRKVWV